MEKEGEWKEVGSAASCASLSLRGDEIDFGTRKRVEGLAVEWKPTGLVGHDFLSRLTVAAIGFFLIVDSSASCPELQSRVCPAGSVGGEPLEGLCL